MTFFYLIFALHSFKAFLVSIWWHLRRPKQCEILNIPPTGTVIEKVPPEVWRTIFSYLDTALYLPLTDHLPTTQIIASQVCRQWRYTLFSMGDLWSHAEINISHMWYVNDGVQNSSYHRNSSFLNETLRQWLRCSGKRPMRLTLGYLPGLLFDTVFRHVAQCTSLTELVIRSDLVTSLSTFSMIPLFARHTTIHALYVDLQEREAWRLDNRHAIHRASPLLTEVFDSGYWQNLDTLHWNCTFAGFPSAVATMPNLRTLSIAGPTSISACVAFLDMLPSLTSLSLVDLDIGHDAAPDHIQYHPAVESLEITFRVGDPYLYLDYFSFPKLFHLSLTSHSPIFAMSSLEHYSPKPANRSFKSLTYFQLRSACTIQSFRICERYPHSDSFGAALTHPSLRAVEHLTIVMVPFNDGTCRALGDGVLENLRYQDRRNLRHLKALELVNIGTTDGLLASVVKSRVTPVSAEDVPEKLEDLYAVYIVEKDNDFDDGSLESWPIDEAILGELGGKHGVSTLLEPAVFKVRPRVRRMRLDFDDS